MKTYTLFRFLQIFKHLDGFLGTQGPLALVLNRFKESDFLIISWRILIK